MRKLIFGMALLALGGCGSEPPTAPPQTEATTPTRPVLQAGPNTTPAVVGSPKLTAIDEELHRQQPAYHPAPAYVYEQAKIGRVASKGEFLEAFNRANRLAGRPDFDPQAHMEAEAAKAGAQ